MKRLFDKKKLVILFLLLSIGFPFDCKADAKVTLQWESNDPSVEGYQIFCREEGQRYDYDNFIWQGDHSFDQHTIEGLDKDKTYYFVVRSYSGDFVSNDSNEVCFPDCSKNESESSPGCMIQSIINNE